MYKVESCYEDPFVKELKEFLGGFNDFPPNWKEIAVEDYVKQFHNSVPQYIEYRQMMDRERRKFTSGILYHNGIGGGYCIVQDFWKGTIKYYTFDCSEKLQEWWDALPIKHDSKWQLDARTSIVRRGIRDYNRIIEFERALTDKEQRWVINYLAGNDCPGYTGILCSNIENQYTFRTTYDSSD